MPEPHEGSVVSFWNKRGQDDTHEDLRAMALSLFIQHARDGGVR